MGLRGILPALVLAWTLAVDARAAVSADFPEIRRVELRALEESFFQRPLEYITGRENTGRRLILRSDPGERRGAYWVVTLQRGRPLPEGGFIEITWRQPGEVPLRRKLFPVPAEQRHKRHLFIGLTGGDWPEEGSRPDLEIWRIRLLDAGGVEGAGARSWLWTRHDEHPPAWAGER